MKTFSCISLFILALIVMRSYAADYETHLESYPVPEHGELVLQVPADWHIKHVSRNDGAPPIITFYDRDDERKQLFQLNVSALWDTGFSRNITAPASVRQLVEKVGQSILKYSQESELVLQSLTGTTGEGFYFNASDAIVRPGEFKYLTQGAVAVGEIVLIFSLFTHDQDSLLEEKTLHMVRTATQKHQRDVKHHHQVHSTRIIATGA